MITIPRKLMTVETAREAITHRGIITERQRRGEALGGLVEGDWVVYLGNTRNLINKDCYYQVAAVSLDSELGFKMPGDEQLVRLKVGHGMTQTQPLRSGLVRKLNAMEEARLRLTL